MLVRYYVIVPKEINIEEVPSLKYVNEKDNSFLFRLGVIYVVRVGFFALSWWDSPLIWENVWVFFVIKWKIYFTIATLKQNSKKKRYRLKHFLSPLKFLKSSLLFTLMMCQFSLLLISLHNWQDNKVLLTRTRVWQKQW